MSEPIYLPLQRSYIIPPNEAERNYQLKSYFDGLALNVVHKTTGWYFVEEVVTNQTFLPDQDQNRQVLRKVVLTGALATGANTVAHNLAVTADWDFLKIYGVITDNPSTVWVPIPNDGVTVTVDTTNININIPAAYNGYSGHVVLEYVKEF